MPPPSLTLEAALLVCGPLASACYPRNAVRIDAYENFVCSTKIVPRKNSPEKPLIF